MHMHVQDDDMDLLFSSMHRIRRLGHVLSPAYNGLTRSQFHMLRTLHFHKEKFGTGLKINELAAHLEQAAPSVSQRINDLEDLGYVVRKFDKADRRSTYVHLTEAGSKVVEDSFKTMLQTMEQVKDTMGKENIREFARLANLLADSIKTVMKDQADSAHPATKEDPVK